MSERYFHGTSSKHLPSILEQGLLSASETGVRNEKRKGGDLQIYLTDDTDLGRLFAEGYAIRAAHKTAGEPVLLELVADPEKHGIVLERQGKIDQYAAPGLPPETIVKQHPVDGSIDRLSDIYQRDD